RHMWPSSRSSHLLSLHWRPEPQSTSYRHMWSSWRSSHLPLSHSRPGPQSASYLHEAGGGGGGGDDMCPQISRAAHCAEPPSKVTSNRSSKLAPQACAWASFRHSASSWTVTSKLKSADWPTATVNGGAGA